MELLKELADSVISGKAPMAKELTSKALQSGTTPRDVLTGLISGMNVVGEKFKNNEFELPLSRKDLAELSGMSQETVIRLLKKFSDDNLILLEGKNVKVIDYTKLQKISQKG